MYTLKKINKTQRSTPRTLFHPPPPNDIVSFLVVLVVIVIFVVVLVVLVVVIVLVNVSIKQWFFSHVKLPFRDITEQLSCNPLPRRSSSNSRVIYISKIEMREDGERTALLSQKKMSSSR